MTRRNSPVQIESSGVTTIAAGYYHSLFIKSDGSLWAMGRNTYGGLGDGTTSNRANPVQMESSFCSIWIPCSKGYCGRWEKMTFRNWGMALRWIDMTLFK